MMRLTLRVHTILYISCIDIDYEFTFVLVNSRDLVDIHVISIAIVYQYTEGENKSVKIPI